MLLVCHTRDPYIYNHLKQLELKKPVIFAGDLNVAHLDLDIHNPGAKHLVKTAGVTPQERSSFSELLATGFQDALRYFYPGECIMVFGRTVNI